MEKIEINGPNFEDVKKTAFKYAIKNAFEHNGEAQLGAVIGKVKALFPNIDLNTAMNSIKETVEEVNTINKEQLKEQYDLFDEAGWELKHIEKEKTLPELTWLGEGEEIITRVAPNPSGAMHFGHARPAILSDEYVKKYGGKLFIRFDDTDPKIKKPIEGIEKEFLEEFKWLNIKVAGIANASNNLDRYYQIIEYLLAEGNAYICFCKSDEWRKLIWEGKACPCREKDAKEQLKEWKKMLKWIYKEGECVVRLKTDLNDKDSSIRDFWLARIVDEIDHPNKKVNNKHVWPAYNLASAVDDHDMEINFIIRGQEHIQNEKKQKYLYNYFKWIYPHTSYHGKVAQVGDMVLSKSKIKVLMEKEGLSRDDDPRLATLKSFRRRGFKPETIRKVIFDLGLNKNEARINMENFASKNKKILGEINNYNLGEGIEIEILMNDGTIKKEKVDEAIKKEKVGDIVQLNKLGFVRIEEINEKIKVVFAHK